MTPKPELVDSHAHLHLDDYADEVETVLERAHAAGVTRIITVGTDVEDNARAVKLAEAHDGVWATVGLHPHDAQVVQSAEALAPLRELISHPKVVAVGECGLDYYRDLSPRVDQEAAFRAQIELAQEFDKAMVWHVRDAFADFWRIIDQYQGLRGVVHCFTAGPAEAAAAVERGFHVALNGIMTFTKDETQLAAARQIPLQHLLLETDCPFLAPVPQRGQRNEPAHLALTAQFLAQLRGESGSELALQTTQNAQKLFGL